MYPTGTHKNIDYQIKKICTMKGPIKRKFMDEWRNIWRESYVDINQYGICKKNNGEGVLTPKGNWSPVNQFNTNYTINIKIVKKINEWIFNDYFLKGINNINGELLREITFENDDPKSIENEIQNYFYWIRHFRDRILIDQRQIGASDFLYDLFEIAAKTMGVGTFAELCVEYHFKKNIQTAHIYRTSVVRGSVDDMVYGCDLFTVNKNDKTKIKKIQNKVVKFFGDRFQNLIDVNDYIDKEINFLSLVSLNYDYRYHTINPDKIVILHLNQDTIIDLSDGWYTYNKKNIVMEEKIDDIFNSKMFFEFFIYCTKNDIEFLVEVSEETKFNYIKEEKKLIANLPTESENFDTQKIYNIWSEIIDNISKNIEDKELMMNNLKNLFKK